MMLLKINGEDKNPYFPLQMTSRVLDFSLTTEDSEVGPHY